MDDMADPLLRDCWPHQRYYIVGTANDFTRLAQLPGSSVIRRQTRSVLRGGVRSAHVRPLTAELLAQRPRLVSALEAAAPLELRYEQVDDLLVGLGQDG